MKNELRFAPATAVGLLARPHSYSIAASWPASVSACGDSMFGNPTANQAVESMSTHAGLAFGTKRIGTGALGGLT